MVKPIRDCRRCGSGDVLRRRHPNYGFYSECLQCGHDEVETDEGENAANPREIMTIRVDGGQGVPELSPIRMWQGRP